MPRSRKPEPRKDAAATDTGAETASEVTEKAQAFLKAMFAAEESIMTHRTDMSSKEWQTCISGILTWLDTTGEIPKSCLTRDVGREILAQLSAVVMLSEYRGDPTSYIA
ncbi:MAG TPA: hypothetical protein VI893_08160 [Thermoplasmata archaeon]|nr:hypothetical protein [Thermoplasmata archaeon]